MDVKKIQAAIDHLKKGGLVIVMDDLDREAEGDLVGLASKATPEKVNFMTKYARGLMCVPMAPAVGPTPDDDGQHRPVWHGLHH